MLVILYTVCANEGSCMKWRKTKIWMTNERYEVCIQITSLRIHTCRYLDVSSSCKRLTYYVNQHWVSWNLSRVKWGKLSSFLQSHFVAYTNVRKRSWMTALSSMYLTSTAICTFLVVPFVSFVNKKWSQLVTHHQKSCFWSYHLLSAIGCFGRQQRCRWHCVALAPDARRW